MQPASPARGEFGAALIMPGRRLRRQHRDSHHQPGQKAQPARQALGCFARELEKPKEASKPCKRIISVVDCIRPPNVLRREIVLADRRLTAPKDAWFGRLENMAKRGQNLFLLADGRQIQRSTECMIERRQPGPVE
jgi:hypothetical protein